MASEAQRAQPVLKERKNLFEKIYWLFVPPIRMVHLGTLLLFYSTLMQLVLIRAVHPRQTPDTIIVLVWYTNVTQSSMQWLAKPKAHS